MSEKSTLDKLKEGFQEAKTAAGLELKYVTAKRTGFKHATEMEDQINIMRAIRTEIPKLRERVSSFTTLEKSLAEAEDKGGAEFTEMSENLGQHPKLAQIEKLYAEGLTAVAAHRFQLHATMDEVKEEWKQLETVDLHELRIKQDQCNRSLTDHRYWKSQNKPAKAAEYENKYKILGGEWVQMIHELRMKKEEALPGYILRLAQAQVLFLRAALQEAERVEASIRSLGPVTPEKFTGLGNFQININNALEYQSGSGGAGLALEYHPSDQPSSPVPVHHAPAHSPVPPPASPVPVQSTPGYPQARAIYPFTGESAQELSFQPGDVLDILTQEGQWWTASLNGRQGLIPNNYVQLLQ